MHCYLDSVGCRLNQAELEELAARLRGSGHFLVPDPEQAEVAIVNTCCVTRSAAASTRSRVRRIHRRNPTLRIVVTGCWATAAPDAAHRLPGVSHVVPNGDKATRVLEVLGAPRGIERGPRAPVPGPRRRTRAFVKVQDGCDHRCTYCLPSRLRGPLRSRPVPRVLREVAAARSEGIQEVVLTGLQLGAWGVDLAPRRHLGHLLDAVLERSSMARIRVSSIEPRPLPRELWERFHHPRLCPHLHLPLQSGCDEMLSLMGRPTTLDAYRALLSRVRAHVEDLRVTTDVLVGHPGEDEASFARSLRAIRSLEFAGGHVFTWSARPGTPAVLLPDRVPPQTARERRLRVLETLEAGEHRFRERLLGRTVPVLWETARPRGSCWQLRGREPHGLRVVAAAPQPLVNVLEEVRLAGMEGGELRGERQSGDRPAPDGDGRRPRGAAD